MVFYQWWSWPCCFCVLNASTCNPSALFGSTTSSFSQAALPLLDPKSARSYSQLSKFCNNLNFWRVFPQNCWMCQNQSAPSFQCIPLDRDISLLPFLLSFPFTTCIFQIKIFFLQPSYLASGTRVNFRQSNIQEMFLLLWRRKYVEDILPILLVLPLFPVFTALLSYFPWSFFQLMTVLLQSFSPSQAFIIRHKTSNTAPSLSSLFYIIYTYYDTRMAISIYI